MDYYINYVDIALTFSIFAVSLNLLMGYAGQMSVAHAAFGAVGGYGAGYMSATYGWGFVPSLLVGALAALVIGAVVSLPALRLTSEYLILLTLAVATIIIVIVTSSEEFGGLYGLLGVQQVSLFGKDFLTPTDFLWILLVLAGIVTVVSWWLGESPFGRVLQGIRDDEVATRSLGKNVFAYKVIVFASTSAMAGLAGAMIVFYNQLASPGQFSFDQSLAIIAMVILGGLGNFYGSFVGAGIIIGSQPFLEKVVDMNPEKASVVRLLAYGLAIVVVLLLRPQGLVPEGFSPFRLRRPKRLSAGVELPAPEPVEEAPLVRPAHEAAARGENAEAPVPAVDGDSASPAGGAPPAPAAMRTTRPAEDGRPETVVEVRDIARYFGGIRAVDHLDFELRRGRITALIGPNGAGKTTVFNLVTGAIKPDTGTVLLRGKDVTGLPPNRIAREGMLRSFQDVRIFPRLSVLENVMMGIQNQPGENILGLLFTPWRAISGEKSTRRAALDYLEFVGLAGKAEQLVGALGFGEQKLVALARILAAEAEVLLLDEPVSGIDERWVETMLDLIERLRAKGRTICIVEHNLHVVERLADDIYFMEEGRVAAQGTMQELMSQPHLVEAYFGTT